MEVELVQASFIPIVTSMWQKALWFTWHIVSG